MQKACPLIVGLQGRGWAFSVPVKLCPMPCQEQQQARQTRLQRHHRQCQAEQAPAQLQALHRSATPSLWQDYLGGVSFLRGVGLLRGVSSPGQVEQLLPRHQRKAAAAAQTELRLHHRMLLTQLCQGKGLRHLSRLQK